MGQGRSEARWRPDAAPLLRHAAPAGRGGRGDHGGIRARGNLRRRDRRLRSADDQCIGVAGAALGAASARRRFHGSRHLQPHRPRRPHPACGRHRLDHAGLRARRHARPRFRLYRRLGRPPEPAPSRHPAGAAAAGAGPGHGRLARAVAAEYHHRHRHPAHPLCRAGRPLQHAGAARAALRRSGEGGRHERDAHRAAPCPAQHASAADRAGDGAVGLGDPDGGLALLPRARHSRALSLLGTDAVGIGGGICAHGAVAGRLPRRRHQPGGVRHQSPRRRAARPARPEAARLMAPATAVLEVEGLRTELSAGRGVIKAVDSVSFALRRGETLAIVGESGCGKSMTALSIMRLVPEPPGKIVAGSVRLDGKELLRLDEAAMRAVRGNDISMIFQEPMTSLNPVLTIGSQISEAVRLHQDLSKSAAMDKAVDMLRLVKIPEPAQRAREYPHQLSGGMRQRAMIAMALACNPKVLIADEPTTALDVTIQAQILDLILDLQKRLGTAVVLITHDLAVVAETAHRVIVMYAGKKVEEADVEELFEAPLHPYTHGLLASIPHLAVIGGDTGVVTNGRLKEIPGQVPALTNLPPGCSFAPRCAFADERCRSFFPPYEQKRPGHWAACWHSEKLYG